MSVCDELCRNEFACVITSLLSVPPPPPPRASLGEVQSAAQADQPHLGLCGDASQRATEVPLHAAAPLPLAIKHAYQLPL